MTTKVAIYEENIYSHLWLSDDYMAVYACEDDIRMLQVNFESLLTLAHRGVIVTARGNDVDFVSRFFCPKYGVNEDPVTGSAHCALTPYWAKKLNKKTLRARQLSKRGGSLICEVRGKRVLISGKTVEYSRATIKLPYIVESKSIKRNSTF